jgi:hypothetical protein
MTLCLHVHPKIEVTFPPETSVITTLRGFTYQKQLTFLVNILRSSNMQGCSRGPLLLLPQINLF